MTKNSKKIEILNSLSSLTLNTTKERAFEALAEYLLNYINTDEHEWLIKANYCFIILLMKEGLLDPEKTKEELNIIDKQKELTDIINKFKS
jgi:hypothetical protein